MWPWPRDDRAYHLANQMSMNLRHPRSLATSGGAALGVGLAFLIWSWLGPIVNLSTFSAVQSVWLQAVIGVLVIVAGASRQLERDVAQVRWSPRMAWFLISSGLSGVLWFASLTALPIAEAVLLYGTSPLITLGLAVALRQERLQPAKVGALVAGFAGLVVLLSGSGRQDGADPHPLVAALLPLAAAALNSVQAVTTRSVNQRLSPAGTVLCILLAQTVVATPFAITQPWRFSALSIGGALLLGVVSSVMAFLLYVNGLSRLRASTVALIGYIEPPLVALWGFLLLGQRLTLSTVVGGVLILGAAYAGVRSEKEDRFAELVPRVELRGSVEQMGDEDDHQYDDNDQQDQADDSRYAEARIEPSSTHP